ncbi:MAG: glycosyltransferase family 2 protein, partial [Chloroflexota bacterium]|nr:glycosyltransferase family 2 protein [Chloroflexota bacterium]
MKLVITIPAYNEERTIAKVIAEIPRSIPGIDSVEVVVINDGSSDATVAKATEAGADQVVSFKRNMGLATAFRVGLETALARGADIIVNTDADFQYDQTQIPDLVAPILEGRADIVLGSRFAGQIESMPLSKRMANQLVSFIVRRFSGLPISDAQTGFRAFTSDAAMQLHITA